MKTNAEIGQEAARMARADVIDMANKKGVTIEKTMMRLRQALNAKETKFFQKDGKVEDTKIVVAHNIRLQATKLALDLLDAMPSEKHDITHSAGPGMAEAVQAYRLIKGEDASTGSD